MSEISGDVPRREAAPAEGGDDGGRRQPPAPAIKRERTSPRQFLREVRSELRKVAWPSRRELLSYSVVVLVTVTLLTLYITGLDFGFGRLILEVFG